MITTQATKLNFDTILQPKTKMDHRSHVLDQLLHSKGFLSTQSQEKREGGGGLPKGNETIL